MWPLFFYSLSVQFYPGYVHACSSLGFRIAHSGRPAATAVDRPGGRRRAPVSAPVAMASINRSPALPSGGVHTRRDHQRGGAALAAGGFRLGPPARR